MSLKFYNTIVLEIRPRIRSVNVIIKLNYPLNNVKIILNSDEFHIITNDINFIVPCKNLNIICDSLSSLNVTDNYISFRFSFNNYDDSGCFKMELINNFQTLSLEKKDLFLNKSSIYDICCHNCDEILGENLKFDRILPLPSENSNSNDWFCHAYHHSNINLNPKINDIFYTQSYFHLNKNIIKNVSLNNLIICEQCTSWLGILENDETIKLWFNTICFKDGINIFKSSPLTDFLYLIKEILSNSLSNYNKIILTCKTDNNQINYILLWILEKQLQVIINDDDNSTENKVAKVLFKCENNDGNIFKQWEKDVNVTILNISKPMVVDILKYLNKFNKLFPKEFSESNGFFVSYLMLNDNN